MRGSCSIPVSDFTKKYRSPLGDITIASDGTSLVGLWFDGQKHFAESLSIGHVEQADLPVFRQTEAWLDSYFGGEQPSFTPPLLMRTSEFRKRIWAELLNIPYGETVTYGYIAKILAKERGLSSFSAQAVGNAVAHNAISLIIPCHRVVGTNGSLTGYAGGLERKAFLLKMEKAWKKGDTSKSIMFF